MATARTVRQLIESALKLCNVYEIGNTLQAKDTSNALRVLQDVIAEHCGDMSVPMVVQEAITLVVSKNSYTIGEYGSPDKNTQRPEQIIGAWVRDSSNYDYPVRIIGEKAYRKIVSKTTETRPDRLWYNPTSPNGTIYVWCTPSAAEDRGGGGSARRSASRGAAPGLRLPGGSRP